jgi:hypothetical protein
MIRKTVQRFFEKIMLQQKAGSALSMAVSVMPGLQRGSGGPLRRVRKAAPIEPEKTHRQLPQVVPGVADRQLAGSPQRIRSMPPERRRHDVCGLFHGHRAIRTELATR